MYVELWHGASLSLVWTTVIASRKSQANTRIAMLDVVDLREFYASPLGQMTRRMLSHRIRSRFRTAQGARVLGVGYAIPYLEPWRAEAERVLAFMPARQGVLHWPQSGLNAAALVEEADLPLPDASIDLALV